MTGAPGLEPAVQQEAGEATLRRIAAVRRPAKANVQPLLWAFADSLAREGVRIAGVVEVGGTRASRGCRGRALRDLSTGAQFSISQELGPGSEACSLDPQGFAQACLAVQREIDRRADLVVLSKFGKMEAQGRGLYEAFAAAVHADVPILTTVSPSLSETWRVFAGSLSQFVSPQADAISRWWSGIALDTLGHPGRGVPQEAGLAGATSTWISSPSTRRA